MDWAARDTTAQSMDNCMATLLWHSARKGACGASYSHTQLKTPEAQKNKLINQALILFLHRYPSLFGCGRLGR
jgi:hypothetical protein